MLYYLHYEPSLSNDATHLQNPTHLLRLCLKTKTQHRASSVSLVNSDLPFFTPQNFLHPLSYKLLHFKGPVLLPLIKV